MTDVNEEQRSLLLQYQSVAAQLRAERNEAREQRDEAREERDKARKERDVVMKDGQLHPYWMTATREALQDALSFQGAMTRVLQEENDELRTKRDEARQDAAAMREMLATAFREGWNCGDWKENCDNVSAREYDWNHSAVKAKADAALTQGDV
jgi:ketopantoate reductase